MYIIWHRWGRVVKFLVGMGTDWVRFQMLATWYSGSRHDARIITDMQCRAVRGKLCSIYNRTHSYNFSKFFIQNTHCTYKYTLQVRVSD
jgi:hypothetical protein